MELLEEQGATQCPVYIFPIGKFNAAVVFIFHHTACGEHAKKLLWINLARLLAVDEQRFHQAGEDYSPLTYNALMELFEEQDMYDVRFSFNLRKLMNAS